MPLDRKLVFASMFLTGAAILGFCVYQTNAESPLNMTCDQLTQDPHFPAQAVRAITAHIAPADLTPDHVDAVPSMLSFMCMQGGHQKVGQVSEDITKIWHGENPYQ